MASKNGSLLALPNEILDAVVRYCHDPWKQHANERYPNILALCLVSRRFRDVTLPVLYETVLMREDYHRNEAFLRKMHGQPSLALLVKDMCLSSAQLSTSQQMVEPPPLPPQPIPHESTLDLQPFVNLFRLSVFDAMLPVFLGQFSVGCASLPALVDCTFMYGVNDSTLGPRDFPVSDFRPFWSLPSLHRFTVGGRAMRLTFHHTSDRNHDPIPSQDLPNIVELQIQCRAHKEAIIELLQIRKTEGFFYDAPETETEDNILNECFEYLAPCMNELRYFWGKHLSSAESRYPNLSNYASITKLSIGALSIANFSDEYNQRHRPELLINFPGFLKHLWISIHPQEVHRRQFYALITTLVQISLSGLDSLDLQLGIEAPPHEPPDVLYWNNRKVSPREQEVRGVPENELYGGNAETTEHINLQEVCDQMKIALSSNYLQILSDESTNVVSD